MQKYTKVIALNCKLINMQATDKEMRCYNDHATTISAATLTAIHWK